MDLCPNCGEELEENAKVCPYCGSDEETGWKPGADYYSVDLPEDDDSPYSYSADDPYPDRPESDPADWVGHALLTLAAVAVAAAGFAAYDWGGVLVLLFLGGAGLFYLAGSRQARRTR